MGRTSDADARLMDAALKLIWEESYGGVSIDNICTQANVKKGSFYYFFKSKADLAVAALRRAWEKKIRPEMDREFSAAVEPLTRLSRYLEAIHRKQVECKKETGRVLGCPVCTVGSEISTQESDVNAEARRIVLAKRRYIESAIRDAVADGSIEACDPAQKTAALCAMIDGLVSQARIMNDPEVARSLPTMGLSLFSIKRSVAVPTEA